MSAPYDIRCYDPSEGEDFTFAHATGAPFSSLQHGLFVIEVIPMTTMSKASPSLSSSGGRESYAQLLTDALRATNATGFVSVSHATKVMCAQVVPEIESGHRLCSSRLGYFERLPGATDRLLAARQQIQTYEEWILGGCDRPFDLPPTQSKWYRKALCYEFEFFLQQANRVAFLFYTSGETREDIILLRPWEGAEKSISAFVSSGA